MTFVDTLCEKIISHSSFSEDYTKITRQSVLEGTGLTVESPLNEAALQRLLQSAAILAQSNNPDWRLIAYRIGIGSLKYKGSLGGVVEATQLILARLGNYPAIKFAFPEDKQLKKLVPTVFYEITGRQMRNTIHTNGGSRTLTDMQKTVWDAIASGVSLALSAPTSAGKSFVFQAYIEQLKRLQPSSNIVYLVPSRALISQVANDLRASGADHSFGVATVPLLLTGSKAGTPIYVLTPERLQVLFHTENNLSFDTVIVDEAHLIGDGSRGIVLYSVLQELQRRKPDAQFLFSSPQVREPSIFGSVVGNKAVRVVKTSDTPVAQNILLIKGSISDSQIVDIFLWDKGQETFLSNLKSQLPIYNSEDRLIYFSWLLGANSQSLVYADGPASCEDIAVKIKNLSSDKSIISTLSLSGPSDDVKHARSQLSNLAKEAVHPEYILAETVQGGVGFHYGRIPALLRNAVEDAFSKGVLDYIVCTSTLLQGVNLPARNIFMQNPHKGEDNPIEPVDFWNLAGRAGRLGKDFQGNVFLIDYSTWASSPLAGPKDEPIKPSFESTLLHSSSELIEFIGTQDCPSGKKPLLEATFSKLLRDSRHGQLQQALDRVDGLSPDTRYLIEGALKKASDSIGLDMETLDASPQISGYRQRQLFDYMMEKISEKGPDYLIPVHPSASWTDALNKLRPIFARVHKYLELKSGQHHLYWAPLALRWMRGDPLPIIIEDAIKYHKSKGKNRSSRTVIRDVLTDVESGLRFRYVNLLGCYVSVLKEALTKSKHNEYVAKIPALTLYLELGAASKTMIQFMNFGISRHTANLLAGLTINKEMDAEAAKAFLRQLNPETSGLSPFLSQELARVISAL